MSDDRILSDEDLDDILNQIDRALYSWENIGGPSDADHWAEHDGDALISIAYRLLTYISALAGAK